MTTNNDTQPGNPTVVFHEGDTIVNFIDWIAGYVIDVTTDDGITRAVYVDESGRNEAGFPTIEGHRYLDEDEVLVRYQSGEEYASLGGTADVGESITIDWQSVTRIEVW